VKISFNLFFSGIVGFIFTMVFVGMLRDYTERDVFYFFTWGFYLAVISSIGVVVSAVIIALFNEYIPPPADTIHYQGMQTTRPQPLAHPTPHSR
jgi:hypothetical protein